MDPGGREVGRSRDDGAAIHDHVLAVHQPAALAAIGGVIQQRHPCVLKDRDGIPLLALVLGELAVAVAVREGHQLSFALALMGRERRIMLPTPGLAVEVLQHHLHLDAPLVLLGQGLGDGGQGELLNRHQNFGSSGADRLKDQGLEVVPCSPLAADGTAVMAVFPLVKDDLDLRVLLEGGDTLGADQLARRAASLEEGRQGEYPVQPGPRRHGGCQDGFRTSVPGWAQPCSGISEVSSIEPNQRLLRTTAANTPAPMLTLTINRGTAMGRRTAPASGVKATTAFIADR